MRHLLLSTAAIAALAGPAFAADLPSTKAPVVYEAPAPVASWTGVYVGVQVGGVATDRNAHDNYTDATATYWSSDWAKSSDTQVLAGGHIGYDYQISNFVIGLVGDLNGRFGGGSDSFGGGGVGLSSYSGIGGGGYGYNDPAHWDASIRGRFGALLTPRALAYVTGGVAFTNFSFGASAGYADIYGSSNNNLYAPHLGGGRTGWTLGGGLEYALDSNWSTNVEYRYTDWGTSSATVIDPLNQGLVDRFSLQRSDNRVSVGLSYKFTGPSAVVAKY